MRATLDATFVALVFIAIAASPFFAVNWFIYVFKRKKRGPFPIKSTLFFIIPVALGFLTSSVSTSIAKNDVHHFLDSLSANYIVSIDGKPAENRDQILDSLKTFHGLMAHHSHPTHTLRVDISDPPRQLSLQVARDSEDPHEYWVFAASPSKIDVKADIGHIKTSVFDTYYDLTLSR